MRQVFMCNNRRHKLDRLLVSFFCLLSCVLMFFRYEASPPLEFFHEKAIHSFIFIICNNCHIYFLFCTSSGSAVKPTWYSYTSSINTIHTSSSARDSTYTTIKTRNHSIHLASLCHRCVRLADSPP